MQPLAEPVPESRLADVLMGELFPRQEIDDTFVDIVLDDLELEAESDYASYEVVRDAFATTEFVRVRDTRYDHIVTVEFPRELGEPTAPVPKFSAPYARIEIEAEEEVHQLELEDLEIEQDFFARGDEPANARFMAYANALPFPLYSAPFERVELGELLTPVPVSRDDATELVVPRRSAPIRMIALALILVCGLALAAGLALLVVRSAAI